VPASRDEAEDLRREMQAHLAFLEDEARMQSGAGADAAGQARARFGDAASYFQQAIEDMTVRQRALRQLVVAGLALGALAVVGGAIGTVYLLRNVEREIVQLRSDMAASSTSLNQSAVACAILVGRWEDPPGLPNTLRIPVTLNAWNSWLEGAGLECGPDESPALSWTSEGWIAKGYHIPEGVTIWFTIERMQEMSPQMADTAARAWLEIASKAKTVRCLPRPSPSQVSAILP
jgi:hypothetical protein